jgi:hypothetical protein
LVPWESFRADIEAVVLTPEDEKKSKSRARSTGWSSSCRNFPRWNVSAIHW